jgi:hypothetical protein
MPKCVFACVCAPARLHLSCCACAQARVSHHYVQLLAQLPLQTHSAQSWPHALKQAPCAYEAEAKHAHENRVFRQFDHVISTR